MSPLAVAFAAAIVELEKTLARNHREVLEAIREMKVRPASPLPANRNLRIKEAAKKIGVSEHTFRREVARGNIPAGIRLSQGTLGWHENLIDRVIADRAAGIKTTTI